jgi:hypothetical protein
MPPSGNQPVRAARKTSSSEVSSGGIERQAIDAPRTNATAMPPRRLPVKIPSARPSVVATSSAVRPSAAVLAAARPTIGATGRP